VKIVNVVIREQFKVDLGAKLTSKELFVISVALQSLKKLQIKEINKELEYYSNYIDESEIKVVAEKLQDDIYSMLRGLQLR
jgi:hypothetical protein